MRNYLLLLCVGITFCNCQKISDLTSLKYNQYNEFIIPSGQQYATHRPVKQVEVTEMKFVVKFDSSAIYKTATAVNQYDINKLYGFSDNDSDHHLFSARFGWSWNDGALRIYGYVYNNGIRISKELGVVTIGDEISCSIKVSENNYIFTLNDKSDSLPRTSTTAVGKGYQLYPYFGGDETAPHDIHIWIKPLQ